LPKDLNETYERILDGINEEDHTLAMNALRWLSFSKRPLRVEELAEASIFNLNADTPFDVGDRFQDPRDILQVLSSLVSTDFKTPHPFDDREWANTNERVEIIRIAHFSVQEYLMSDRMPPSLAKTFQIQELVSHQTITECCLHYIDFCNTRGVIRKSQTRSDKPYPLFFYSSEYWVDHAKLCNDTEYAYTDLACRSLSTESWVRNWFPKRNVNRHYRFEKAPALYWEAFLGITGVAKKLIHSGANINALGGYYGTALQAACYAGQLKIANLFLENGADVNAQEGKHKNAINGALQGIRNYGGNPEVVQTLLEHGAAFDDEGNDAMIRASSAKDYKS
jgi:hypothetical protein